MVRGVVRTAHLRVVDRALDDRDEIVEMDPAHVLSSAADGAAESPAREAREHRECAAVAAEHDAEAQHDATRVRCDRGTECGFPLPAHVGHEVVAVRSALVAYHVAGISVDADRARLNPDGHGGGARADRVGDRAHGDDARGDDLAPILIGVTTVDALAGEIDDRHRAIELFRPRAEGASVPGDLAHAVLARVGLARQHHDVVAALSEMRGKRRAQEAATAGDDDAMK